MQDDDKPYVIHSPSKITLSPLAKAWAREWGMTDAEMAKHLLGQEKLRQAGLTQKPGEN
jgi:hypothetical protein